MDKIPVPFSAEDKQRLLNDQAPESIDALIKELNLTYEFDYGTICQAVGLVAVLAAKKMNSSPQGGITGFQAGAVMWEFIKEWMHIDGPMKLVTFHEMLYPQYYEAFKKTIQPETWEWLKNKAKENLVANTEAHPDVIAHWESIVNGVVPFGYTAKKSF